MRIFVTGAGGFIAKHLVKALTQAGNYVCVNVRKPIQDLPLGVETIQLNENDIDATIKYFQQQQFDGIIHLASLYITVHKPDEVCELINSNVRFSTFMLEAAAKSNIAWFINTGTFWQHYLDADYAPVNLYAATKQAFEVIAKYYIDTQQIKFVSLHLSDTYGPGDTRPKIFNLWERIAKSGETLDMSGGEQIIDISHVDSVVDAFAQLAMHVHNNNPKLNNGDVFALKAAKRYSLKQLAAKYETDHGVTLNINWGARPYREREVMMPWNGGRSIDELE